MWDLIKTFLSKFWHKLLDWLWWILDSSFSPLHWLLVGLFYVIKAVFLLIIDGFFTVVELFFMGLDSASLGFLSSPSINLHPVLIWFVYQLGIVQGISIIVTALSLRLLLNLIPASFTRI
jgi:hypothetical protein